MPVYGTRHFKGLVEFRKAEKEALKIEESVRTQAREQAKETLTGQGLLFSLEETYAGTTFIDPRFSDHEKAKDWVLKALEMQAYEYK